MGCDSLTGPVRQAMAFMALVLATWWPTPTEANPGERKLYQLEGGGLSLTIAVGVSENTARFDETAAVVAASWSGRDYLIAPGLVDEFGLEGFGVLGFQEAAVGAEFLKIGVGVLERDRPGPYRFQHPYPKRRTFTTDVVANAHEIRVTQVSEQVSGYRYAYEKSYFLGDERTLTIHYELQNCGVRPFSFEHYNHNFFRLPDEAGAYGIGLDAGFALNFPPPEWERVSARAVRWAGETFPETGRFWRLPLTPPAEEHQVTLTWQDGYAVRITGTTPVNRFAVWLDRNAVCPELFSRFSVEPGETVRWTRRYHFGTAAAGGQGSS